MAVLQVGGLGPMAEQAHHLRVYANVKDDYAIDRYERESRKLYAVVRRSPSGEPLLGRTAIVLQTLPCALGVPSCTSRH